MNLEQQVCSLEPSKKLKELGVKQESVWAWKQYWSWDEDHEQDVKRKVRDNHASLLLSNETKNWKGDNDRGYDFYSAFTVAELGEMLPLNIGSGADIWWLYCTKWNTGYAVQYNTIENGGFNIHCEEMEETEADARAKMLIYLIENKLIEAHGIIGPKDGAKPRKVL